ncbi:MAG TPA: transcriptional repressor LexA [Erythrobacter sp.]|jgi:repressor LexA|uniref:LexA repressor n=1 Tax=Qipengyuania citrea LAMA 915 TaxID=1306953 RepID=A0A0L1KBN8_9SPHN|nr:MULTISPECIES: transcriptional repressor LexA [Erythrobacteraceae]MAC30620.1 transcriptional repressor LexA [Erythrobacter sp.]MAG04882.1 transcriptional repressor LexA [Sphingomonadaceae bacterium]MBN90186.1 transcriptional repressor LexA [Erythrobacteraceae bacterium]MCZ4265555.1 transcriptional repressor LexA [Erythrobacter sp. G21629-S1]KNH01299.1 SOS-response repressor and protease LexA [Qipengyuania citrea LAMA 915]|tara:strand:+ start:2414 stop:3103 length:690 start_codon:yes stop_codon:yes gene_type:complete
MLTAKQHELIRFIQQRLEDTGISPSFEEMKEALDLKSKSGVHRLISALEERGFIRRLPNRARALEVVKLPEDAVTGSDKPSAANDLVGAAMPTKTVAPEPANDIIDVPLHGRIAAGAPIEAIEGQSSMPVPAALLGPGEHYALEVSGDSMIEAGIFDGDFALVKRTDSARDGEIVVALVDNEEATLKYLRKDAGRVILDPANGAYDPQVYDAHRVQVQGKLAGLLRRYH